MRDLVYAIKIQKIDEESNKKNVEEKKNLKSRPKTLKKTKGQKKQ